MARGRSRTSPEAKAAKKERAAADKAEVLALNALAKLPAEKERRDELWQELDALKSEASGVSGSISAQKKRMNEVFGITKAAMQIRAILNKCRSGEYEATVQQVQLFMADTNRPFQLSMSLEPGKGVAEDQGSVFDSSRSGETVSAERGDDPGRASKRRGPPPAPVVTTPNVGVEGLAAGIKQLEGPKPPVSGSDDFEDGPDVRSPDMVRRDEERKAKEAEDATKSMTPAERRAHAKKIANEVFAKQGGKGLGPDAIH